MNPKDRDPLPPPERSFDDPRTPPMVTSDGPWQPPTWGTEEDDLKPLDERIHAAARARRKQAQKEEKPEKTQERSQDKDSGPEPASDFFERS